MAERTILTLVRHGQTVANAEKVWHGSIDTPLSERGMEQARRVARHLARSPARATAVYTSPQQRARHTAQLIAEGLGLEPRVDADLSEFTLGAWEGRSYADLHRVERMWDRMAADPDYAPPGGESARAVALRVAGALRRIWDAHPGSRVVVVSHGGALTLGLGFLLDGVANAWSRVVDNCSMSDLVLEPEPVLLRFNATEHLGETAERFDLAPALR